MRYFLQFADKSSKTVSLTESQAQDLLSAWAQGKPVVVAGVGYANHFISVIKPMKQWAQEEYDRAKADGKKLCAHGTRHERLSDCVCGPTGRGLIPELQELLPARRTLPEAPQTPEEKAKAQAWVKQRSHFIQERTMPAAEPCKRCEGKGSLWFKDTWIVCECSHAVGRSVRS